MKGRIHFIGIGGISMSGLAEIMHRDGYEVSGSDDVLTGITEHLESLGIKVYSPNKAENISDNIETIVYTAAVKPDNPEFIAAQEKGIELIERAPFIGKILHGYDPICIAGSHGKTTTTSMISEVLLKAKLDPTISIGGHMNHGGMNYRVGNSKNFVLEACEYSNSFHHFHPHVGIILNLDADHLDFFGSMENLIASFKKFASNIRPEGALIIHENTQGFDKITTDLKCKVITFGLSKNADFRAENIDYSRGKPSFDVSGGDLDKTARNTVNLPLPGEYNMLNALAGFAAASYIGVSPEVISQALSSIQGTKRRFEHKGTIGGVEIIDDYAHHPTEVRACLAAARQKVNQGKIICVFQPHTYTRTKNLLHEFAESFSDADKIILLPIYAAREPFDPTISSEILAKFMKMNGGDVISVENFVEAGNFINATMQPKDIVITMGAGDVFKVGENLISQKLSTLSTVADE
ncbi:MAG: UDP-N-acetylmuramate--L-alanine ligase [Defluviitaleaceae bacterium]|nr:UDP-N-acetylmuramate--L-alanine ligase [Defluviitaleaceae bacterium]